MEIDLGLTPCNKENTVYEIWGNLLSHSEIGMDFLLERVAENCQQDWHFQIEE